LLEIVQYKGKLVYIFGYSFRAYYLRHPFLRLETLFIHNQENFYFLWLLK